MKTKENKHVILDYTDIKQKMFKRIIPEKDVIAVATSEINTQRYVYVECNQNAFQMKRVKTGLPAKIGTTKQYFEVA